jgi:hypothetical protein
MSRHRSASFIFAWSLVLVLVGSAVAQESDAERSPGWCFELIAPQHRAQPNSPLLFNKCTGATWLLVKRRNRIGNRIGNGSRSLRSTYHWALLDIEKPPHAAGNNRTVPARRLNATSGESERKCFEFVGRRFCEL